MLHGNLDIIIRSKNKSHTLCLPEVALLAKIVLSADRALLYILGHLYLQHCANPDM